MEDIRRIVVLGKTGAGKSSLLNTVFGENVFPINDSVNSGTSVCQSKLKKVDGKSILLTDTPGFFDTLRSEKEMEADIVKCITECAPGPHVFIIVFKVQKFTEQEKQIIKKLTDIFSDEVLKFAMVLFTHGDWLPEGMQIDHFVNESEELSNLVKKCGGRYNVLDNRYWKETQDDYRNNIFQVKELLNTIDKIFEANNGGFYTKEMLQMVKRNDGQALPNLSLHEETKKAKDVVRDNRWLKLKWILTGALLGGFLGGGIQLRREGGAIVPLVLGLATGIGLAAGAAHIHLRLR
ncbi:hypothetical protein CHARACLAT_019511 [Characodon lateralis]|uniref:AIG1-type G domain-containing protein n=1 Tax=Characodon lateralis TaxID=208331 RepID=A0ABU7DVM0_9TELE|nr:hypothetical protein [Characodon lateralis]